MWIQRSIRVATVSSIVFAGVALAAPDQPDIYGIQIGMSAEQVVSALSAAHPELTVAHINSDRPMIKAESQQKYMDKMGSGLLAINSNWACDLSSGLEGWHCTDEMQFRIELPDSEVREIQMNLTRPFGEPRSVAVFIEFHHTIPANTRFIVQEFVDRKYGEQKIPASGSLVLGKSDYWSIYESPYGQFGIRTGGYPEVIGGGRHGRGSYRIIFELDSNVPKQWAKQGAEARKQQNIKDAEGRQSADDPF